MNYLPDFGWYLETFTYYFTPSPVKELGLRLMMDDTDLAICWRFGIRIVFLWSFL
ncbi:hypothetical protein K8T06_14900 [bacterium]|nr:hypothetical protein [bacterium]